MPMTARTRNGLTAVALVLVVAAAFMIMTAGAGDSVNLGLQHASRVHYERRTNYAAYGAMQLALDKLNTDRLYSTIDHNVVVPGDDELVYDLEIYNNYDGSFVNPAPDGRIVPKYMAYIKTKSDFRAYPGKYTTSMYSKGYLGNYLENFAVVGTDQVTITNSTVDGFFVASTRTGLQLKPSSAGRVATNSVQDAGLVLNGTATNVSCNLIWGPYGNESTVYRQLNGAQFDPAKYTKGPGRMPIRVPRFRPPRDPRPALSAAPINISASQALPEGDYNTVNVTGCTLTLTPGKKYFIAQDFRLQGATLTLSGTPDGSTPCDIYIGRNFDIDNSTVNWDNIPTTANLADQAVKGPRVLRVYFVGSGAPRYKDSTLTIKNNSKVSMHASGKALKTELLSGSEMWGGVKGFRFTADNAQLHYHRVELTTTMAAVPPLPQAGLASLFPAFAVGVLAAAPPPVPAYPVQPMPDAAWCLQGLADEDAEANEAADDMAEYYGGS